MQNFMQDIPDDLFVEPSGSVNFDLYIKVREISQISDHLYKITLKSRKEQKKWAKENRQIIEDMFDAFVGDSVSVMSGIRLDGEAMELSMTFMEKMRFVTATIHDLLPEEYDKKIKRKI